MPETKVGGDGVEIVLQAIRAEDGHTAIGEPGFEFVQDRVSHPLATLAYLEDGDHCAPGEQSMSADLWFCLICPFVLAKWAIFFAVRLHLPDFGRF